MMQSRRLSVFCFCFMGGIVQGGFRESSERIQRGFREDSERIQRGFREDSERIQRI